MSKKIEETIVIRNEKMSYAVRLCSKLEGEGSRLENRNPYMVVEDGKIKYLDSLYGNKSEFNFNDEVHAVAKEIFISGLRTAIKEEILRLKQLELVLNEMGLTECIGNTLEESATFLQRVKGFPVDIDGVKPLLFCRTRDTRRLRRTSRAALRT